MSPEQRLLNLTAQGRVPIELALKWFRSREGPERASTLHELARMIYQAHATSAEAASALVRSGLKPTYTPCVLFSRNPPAKAAFKASQLPDDEHEKAFTLMLHVFERADARRREQECRGACTHEWHNLAPDDDPLRELLTTGGA